MGQYFDVVNMDKRQVLCLPEYPFVKLGHMAREKAWDNALIRLLAGEWRGDQVVVLGDYADDPDASLKVKNAIAFLRYRFGLGECVQDWLSDLNVTEVTGDPSEPACRYVCNHRLKTYIDCGRYPGEGTVVSAPLVLLLALGNGVGGGDYTGPEQSAVGSWATTSYFVTAENSMPESGEYKEILPFFGDLTVRAKYLPKVPGYCEEIPDPRAMKNDLLRIFSDYDTAVHTNEEEEYSYLEDGDIVLAIRNPWQRQDMEIELADEFSLFFAGWHAHYCTYVSDYNTMLRDAGDILRNRKCVVLLTLNGKPNASSLEDHPMTQDEFLSVGFYGELELAAVKAGRAEIQNIYWRPDEPGR